jgi:hypothetical protein
MPSTSATGAGTALLAITMGEGLGPIDRDRVLLAALTGALGEIRRRGA